MNVLMDEQLEGLRPGHLLRTRSGARVCIEKPLGAGNEGVVFRGILSGAAVAVKIFKPDASGRRARRTRALVEANLSRSVSSSIAGPFDELEEWEGRAGHVAPLVAGFTVQELVDSPGHLSPRQRLLATIKLGALIAALHRRGLAFGDLNKGAVKVAATEPGDVRVSLVDLDSAVLPGSVPPMTLGTPDTCAPELREGVQPVSVAAWQAADWCAYGHVALELLTLKTASCGLDDPAEQVAAFMGMPPCLQDSPRGLAIDLAAGLPVHALPMTVRRPLARLFCAPAQRDGRALVQALASELVNNHQVACTRCGAQYLAADETPACPACGKSTGRDYQLVLPTGARHRINREGYVVGRAKHGNDRRIEPVHLRFFSMGAVPFVAAFGNTTLRRAGRTFRLPMGIHVPLQRNDCLSVNSAVSVLVI